MLLKQGTVLHWWSPTSVAAEHAQAGTLAVTVLSLINEGRGLHTWEDCRVVLQVQWSVPDEQVSESERPQQVTGANGTNGRRADTGAGLAGLGLPSREEPDPAAPEGLAEHRQSWQPEAPAPREAGAATDRRPGAQPGFQSSSSWIAAESIAQAPQPGVSYQSRQAPAAASKADSAGPDSPGCAEEAGAPHRPTLDGSRAQQAPDHDGGGGRSGAASSSVVLGTTTQPAADGPEVDLESFESLLSAGKELFRQVHTL